MVVRGSAVPPRQPLTWLAVRTFCVRTTRLLQATSSQGAVSLAMEDGRPFGLVDEAVDGGARKAQGMFHAAQPISLDAALNFLLGFLRDYGWKLVALAVIVIVASRWRRRTQKYAPAAGGRLEEIRALQQERHVARSEALYRAERARQRTEQAAAQEKKVRAAK